MKVVDELMKEYGKAIKAVVDVQVAYDAETQHGRVVVEQKRWGGKYAK